MYHKLLAGAGTVHRIGTWLDELGFDLPTTGDRFLDQDAPFDHEGAFVPTSTAAPQEAPQSLNDRVLVTQLPRHVETLTSTG